VKEVHRCSCAGCMHREQHHTIPVVLVVDDDETIREMLQLLLEGEGYRVVLASDGITGLAVALVQQIDAILLDLAIPRLTGEAFCRAYRERGGTAAVILMTAATGDRVEAARITCASSTYLAKPFSVMEVLTALSEYLGPASASRWEHGGST
jgi:DNA-binding response OmpR family regulator